MSAITLSNVAGLSAEICLFQGINRIARIPVPDRGSAQIPTTTEYTAQAFTAMGEFSLSSNPVNFASTSIVLLAQVLAEKGFFDFQLVERPGVSPSAITLENTWKSPVQFKLHRPNSPFEIVTVVDEHNQVEVSTAQRWTAYAIINGISTETVSFTDPNARVTLTTDGDGGYALDVNGGSATRNENESQAAGGAPSPDVVKAFISEKLAFSDHVSGTVVEGGAVVGFSESQRQGRAAHGSMTPAGAVDHGFAGPPPTNETGTLDACQRLVRQLNASGGQWVVPIALSEDLPHVDCRVESAGTAGEHLDVQVVRAMTDPAHWHEVGREGGRAIVGETPDDAANALRRSIELKRNRIPPEARAGLVLALDANDTPAFAFDAVLAAFRAAHGEWAASVGFQAIWLVGPVNRMIHRLV